MPAFLTYLTAVERLSAHVNSLPPEFSRLESTFPGIEARTSDDAGRSPSDNGRWVLRWEMMPVNRDKPLDGPPPPPSMLRLYRIVDDTPQPSDHPP
jgi:hypothetical protein